MRPFYGSGRAPGVVEPEELIASWTLVDDDWWSVGNKSGATRLGFALMLKFFEIEARFPRCRRGAARRGGGLRGRSGQGRAGGVLGRLLMVGTGDRATTARRSAPRSASGSSTRARRGQAGRVAGRGGVPGRAPRRAAARGAAGAVPARADRAARAGWTGSSARRERCSSSAFCDAHVDAAGPGRARRLGAPASPTTTRRRPRGGRCSAELKADPGQLGLETLLGEIDKLTAVRALGLPAELFAGCSREAGRRLGGPGRRALYPVGPARPRRGRCG